MVRNTDRVMASQTCAVAEKISADIAEMMGPARLKTKATIHVVRYGFQRRTARRGENLAIGAKRATRSAAQLCAGSRGGQKKSMIFLFGD
jgi:hypothetical protein